MKTGVLSTAKLIGVLREISIRLTSKGLHDRAASLENRVDQLLDYELEVGTPVLLPVEDEPGLVVSSSLVASVAARTAKSADTPPKRVSRQEWKRIRRNIKMHSPRAKRWICCFPVERRRTRRGKQTWGAVCRYKLMSGKKRGVLSSMWIGLGSQSAKPRKIEINGKKMSRRCKS